jgi:hypothetical protein
VRLRAVKRALLAVLTIATLVAAYFAGIELNFWPPLNRPPEVSRHARHFSNVKGSTWFDCRVDTARDVDLCAAWDESGRVIAYGAYRIDGANRAATAAELRPLRCNVHRLPQLSWIYLEGEKVLVPVNRDGIPLERFDVRVPGDNR